MSYKYVINVEFIYYIVNKKIIKQLYSKIVFVAKVLNASLCANDSFIVSSFMPNVTSFRVN